MNTPISSYVLGSDIGTGSCKTVLLDETGSVVAAAGAEYPTAHPHPGWAEQNPVDWYAAFCQTTRQVLAASSVAPPAIKAVCIVGVTHNPVLLDRDEKVLRPAIHFWDQRSQHQVRKIKERWGNSVRERALNEVSTLWTWPQLFWLRQHEPDVWQRMATILFPKDYVRHRLAPSLLTDTIDPAGTLLYDPRVNEWIEPFIRDLGLPLSALPAIQPATEVAGHVCRRGASDTGLRQGTPVLTGTTDTAAELVGSGALKDRQAVVKLASVGRIMIVMDKPLDDPHSLNYPHFYDGLWYPGSVTKYGAGAYRWAREAFWPDLKGVDVYKQMDTAVKSIPPGSGGILFHPHLSGEYAPNWDPRLRASFVGLTVDHTRVHITRAILEGVAFQIRSALAQLKSAGGFFDDIRLIGGGANSPLWSQIMADVLGHSLLVPSERSAAYGAGLLAGIGVGLFPSDPDLLGQNIRIERHLEVNTERQKIYKQHYKLFQKADKVLTKISHQLAK